MGGCFFVKKWTFPKRRVHYVQYRYFLFYILLFFGGGGAYAPNAPPAYGPGFPSEHGRRFLLVFCVHFEA